MATRQTGWRRCSKCSGLVYFGRAVCPAGEVHDHAGSSDFTLNFIDAATPNDTLKTLQTEWKWCKKCQTLAYNGAGFATGPCPDGGVHDHSGSGNYGLPHDQPSPQGQSDWRYCSKCSGLFYSGPGGTAPPGKCLAGGVHDGAGSWNYALSQDGRPVVTNGQNQWRRCNRCNMLAYDGSAACAGGGSHIHAGSELHTMEFDTTASVGQHGWKWCGACYSIVYAAANSNGVCPSRANGHMFGGQYVMNLNGNGNGSDPSIQYKPGWKYCNKCQMLWNTETGPGRCPSTGGSHSSEGSGDYSVAIERGAASLPGPTVTVTTPCQGAACASPTLPAGGPTGSSAALSTGAAAGIGVGVGAIVLAACVAGVVFWLRRRKAAKRASLNYAAAPASDAAAGLGQTPMYMDPKEAPVYREAPAYMEPKELSTYRDVAELPAGPISPRHHG